MTDLKIAENLYKSFEAWLDIKAEQDQQKELDPDRLGKLRGGSCGFLDTKGKIYGTCPRKALARSWGFNARPDDDKRLMFEQGKSNEGFWDEIWTMMFGEDAGIPEGHKDSVISWTTPDGRVVEGSPDYILKKFLDVDKVLLEYKRISSVWTARKVSIKKFPKKDHIIQAGHYMGVSQLDNGVIIYKQDVDFPCPSIGKADTTALWPVTSPIVEYDGDYPRRVMGHVSMFDLLWEGGSLWFRHHTETDWRQSTLTMQGIHDYYWITSRQEKEKFLANKPARTSPVGDTGDSFSACDFCELKDICKDKGLSYDAFENQVKELIPKS